MMNKGLLHALEEFLRGNNIPEETWASFSLGFKLKAGSGLNVAGETCSIEIGPEVPRFTVDLKRYYVKAEDPKG